MTLTKFNTYFEPRVTLYNNRMLKMSPEHK